MLTKFGRRMGETSENNRETENMKKELTRTEEYNNWNEKKTTTKNSRGN